MSPVGAALAVAWPVLRGRPTTCATLVPPTSIGTLRTQKLERSAVPGGLWMPLPRDLRNSSGSCRDVLSSMARFSSRRLPAADQGGAPGGQTTAQLCKERAKVKNPSLRLAQRNDGLGFSGPSSSVASGAPSIRTPTSPLLLSACCCSRPVADWLAERMADAGTKMQVKIFETIPLKAASSIDGERIGWASARHCLCMLRSSAWNLHHNHMPVG